MSITDSIQIRAEPNHTCPLIDSVIEILDEQFGNKDSSIKTMEKIRINCSDLRDWGSEWKELAEHHESNAEHHESNSEYWEKKYDVEVEENSDKTDQIITLQKTIETLENKVYDLEYDLKHNYRKIEE